MMPEPFPSENFNQNKMLYNNLIVFRYSFYVFVDVFTVPIHSSIIQIM